MTYALTLRPAEKRFALLYDVGLVVAGSLLMALSAQIAIRLPFSPVPVTGQTFAVLLIGAMYGRKLGLYSVLAYLTEGAAGLPFFAGGMGGAAYLAGPTGGYLLGFAVAAYLMGFLAENGWDRKYFTTIAAMLMSTAVVFVFGLAWLGFYTGWNQVIAMGFVPFIPGAVYKIALASVIPPSGWKLMKKLGR